MLKDTLAEGIYFIGFDQSHVGYIHRKGDELILIHSNYINAQGVIREDVESSMVFNAYDRIYIAPISSNMALLTKWLPNEPIRIFGG